MQVGQRQVFFEQRIRQGQALAAPARREAALDEMGDDHQAELQPLGLMHRHQVDGVDGVLQGGDLFVRLRRLGEREVVEVGP
jgi:hypothetical protein